jgi:hypothetical protein
MAYILYTLKYVNINMACKYCNNNSDTNMCEKCQLYFNGLNEQQIIEKINEIYGNINKMKPEYIIWFGLYKDKDIRESNNDEEFKRYLLTEYFALGECPLKLGIKETLRAHLIIFNHS